MFLLQMVVMQRPNKLVADVNIAAQALADKCKDGGVASVWVSQLINLPNRIFLKSFNLYSFCSHFLLLNSNF